MSIVITDCGLLIPFRPEEEVECKTLMAVSRGRLMEPKRSLGEGRSPNISGIKAGRLTTGPF